MATRTPLAFNISPAEREWLARAASVLGITPASVMREALRRMVARLDDRERKRVAGDASVLFQPVTGRYRNARPRKEVVALAIEGTDAAPAGERYGYAHV